jgi:thimet oligopeptidase
MLEEWIWDYETLKEFAYNQQGEVIPEQLVEKMRTARDFARGTHIQNQMFYASLSLAIYQTPPDDLDLKETMIQLQTEYSPFAYIDDTHFYASFGHLFGYSAAYYTYMWSEVIAADILEQFKDSGMRNKEVADRYRKTVLAPGGSQDAAQLVEDFLGRPFNFDAFVKRLNQDT